MAAKRKTENAWAAIDEYVERWKKRRAALRRACSRVEGLRSPKFIPPDVWVIRWSGVSSSDGWNESYVGFNAAMDRVKQMIDATKPKKRKVKA